MSSVVLGCAASAVGSNAIMSARLFCRLIGVLLNNSGAGHRTPFYSRSSSMKSHQGFRFGITTVGCAHLLAACGGGGAAPEPAASAASSAPAAAPAAQSVAAADW